VNLVDSSGWLKYFADGENVSFFALAIEDTAHLIVPTICLYEVFKRLMAQRGESVALVHIAAPGTNCRTDGCEVVRCD